MNYQEVIREFFSKCDGKITSVFYEALGIIESFDKDEQPAAVMYLCENVFKIDTDASKHIDKDYYTVDQFVKSQKRIKEKFLPRLREMIMKGTKESVPAIEFYKAVWELIQSTSIFKSKRERALGLYALVEDELIPYRTVGTGLTMDEDEYDKIYDRLDKEMIAEIAYILDVEYEQKTQRSSLLIDKILGVKTTEERAVLMALILNIVERNVKSKIKDRIDEV